jgi:hypothetical protein
MAFGVTVCLEQMGDEVVRARLQHQSSGGDLRNVDFVLANHGWAFFVSANHMGVFFVMVSPITRNFETTRNPEFL